jgi:DnaK suppressor protein
MKNTPPPPPREIPPQWRWHYRALLRARRRLLQESEAHSADLRGLADRDGSYISDTSERQTEETELIAELAAERTDLAEIDAALHRILAGTYGRCEATGCLITLGRLHALPWTRLSHAAARVLQDATH